MPWFWPEARERKVFWWESTVNSGGKVLRALERLPWFPLWKHMHLCKCIPAPATWCSESEAHREGRSHVRVLPALCSWSCLKEEEFSLCAAWAGDNMSAEQHHLLTIKYWWSLCWTEIWRHLLGDVCQQVVNDWWVGNKILIFWVTHQASSHRKRLVSCIIKAKIREWVTLPLLGTQLLLASYDLEILWNIKIECPWKFSR